MSVTHTYHTKLGLACLSMNLFPSIPPKTLFIYLFFADSNCIYCLLIFLISIQRIWFCHELFIHLSHDALSSSTPPPHYFPHTSSCPPSGPLSLVSPTCSFMTRIPPPSLLPASLKSASSPSWFPS